jgi:hypothetical protein
VVAYLSGLRPAEILHLQPGCCPAPDGNDTGPVRYRLHGVKFKAARNDDGTPAPDGETLTDDERAAVDDGQAAFDKLLGQLADTPTPAGPTPRQLCHPAAGLPLLQILPEPRA